MADTVGQEVVDTEEEAVDMEEEEAVDMEEEEAVDMEEEVGVMVLEADKLGDHINSTSTLTLTGFLVIDKETQETRSFG